MMITKSKIAGLSLVAKFAMGVGIAAASTSGAAAFGVLPDIGGDDPTIGSGTPNEAVVFDDVGVEVDEGGDAATTTVPVVATTVVEVASDELAPLAPESESGPDTPVAPPVFVPPAPEPEPAPEPNPVEVPGDPAPPGDASGSDGGTLALECFQHDAWWGVICEWDSSAHTGVEYYLRINGTPERIWGDNPTSFVDVHADTIGQTYTYSLIVMLDDEVVGESDQVTIVLEQWASDSDG